MNEEHTPPPRSLTSPYGMHIDPQTKIGADLRTIIVVVGALLAAGFAGGMGYFRLTTQVEVLGERVSQLPTKLDLVNERAESMKVMRARFKAATVRCPKQVPRGDTVVTCEIILQTRGGDE